MKTKPDLISEDVLKNVAYVIGENAGSYQVLEDIERRRNDGQDPVCFQINHTYYVTDRKIFENTFG